MKLACRQESRMLCISEDGAIGLLDDISSTPSAALLALIYRSLAWAFVDCCTSLTGHLRASLGPCCYACHRVLLRSCTGGWSIGARRTCQQACAGGCTAACHAARCHCAEGAHRTLFDEGQKMVPLIARVAGGGSSWPLYGCTGIDAPSHKFHCHRAERSESSEQTLATGDISTAGCIASSC